jgi:hypothetical protein
MKTTQDKVLKHLQVMADHRDLELVVDFSFSNTGTIRFQEGFSTLCTIGFSFQTNYADFNLIKGGGGSRLDALNQGTKHLVQYGNVQDWTMLWAAIEARIGPAKDEEE